MAKTGITIYSGAAQGSILGPLFWNLVYDAIVQIKIDPSNFLALADYLGPTSITYF